MGLGLSVCQLGDFCQALCLSVCWVGDFCRALCLSVCWVTYVGKWLGYLEQAQLNNCFWNIW